MPLVQGSSQKSISENIRRLNAENSSRSKPRSHDQEVAIALSIARKSKIKSK